MECFLVGPVEAESHRMLLGFARELGLTTISVDSLVGLRSERRFTFASRPLVIILNAPDLSFDVAAVIDFARDQEGRSFTLLVAEAIAPSAYKQLVRTGAADWITPRDCRQELRDIVARMSVTAAPRRAATIISVLPSKGGVGNTTVVAEVAWSLTRASKRNITTLAVLDLNLQGGTIADALDLEPRFDVAELIRRPERLDDHLVDVFKSHHPKGFDVFAAPMGRTDPALFKPEIVFAFIDVLASRYGVLLFDLPVQLPPWADDLLRGSDAVVVCGGESVPALRRLAATLTHLDDLGLAGDRIAAVVNPVETGLLGRVSRRALIEKAIPGRRVILVRRDEAHARHALDVGRALTEISPQSRIVRDLRPLGRWAEAIVERGREPRRAAGTEGAFA